ncbi:uncharacterized protein LOC129942186 [Eupeodes corollae]|uniref:uncharacterized protein LOC129942186 n=1 Tax=Eupeodes corollae TaxID=290404 RepID=UPI002492824C|nr:uncharacterized protein LOC129942186 [Eupeodes corollae]
MFKIFVCVLVLAAAVSADYDFKDSEFNELLLDDFQLGLEDDEVLRFRRGAEVAAAASEQKECTREKNKKDKDCFCCNGSKADPAHVEVMKEVKKECIAQIRGASAPSYDPFDCEQMKLLKEQSVCTAECIAKRFNLVDEHGDMKRESVLVNLRAKIGDNNVWKSEAVEGFVDKCLAELKASKEKSAEAAAALKKESQPIEKESRDEKVGCNPCPLEFSHCIWREVVQGCPAESQIDSGKCKKIREGLAKGDKSFLNKHFLHHFSAHSEDKKSWE